MRKVLLMGLAAGFILWGCGGGGGGDGGDGSGDASTVPSYGIKISSFTADPDTVSLGQSFILSAGYSFSSANGTVYWEIKISDQSGSVDVQIARFYCGGAYGCPTSFSVTCDWFTNQYGQWLTCTNPSGDSLTIQPYSGSYTVTLKGCVWAVTRQLCDAAAASVTLQ
ncbi:MAG TPA: hypothetical protein ENJ61_00380 [Aquifex aeolicus]|uniref:Uncharacterized protein n=1 Tax=Aquifex aeolicus TaxID=63363 RepID=A0A7C5QH26_AQUAO|nr:hypothetical protein [Aquifex aeolicus]